MNLTWDTNNDTSTHQTYENPSWKANHRQQINYVHDLIIDTDWFCNVDAHTHVQIVDICPQICEYCT